MNTTNQQGTWIQIETTANIEAYPYEKYSICVPERTLTNSWIDKTVLQKKSWDSSLKNTVTL